MFVFFQHHHPGAFAHHKAVAAFVPRARGGGRVVVAGGQRFHGGKTADAQGTNRAFGTAGHHYIGIAVHNHARGVANAVRTGGTGRHHAVAGALIAFEDGDVSGNQVNQRAGNKKRIDFAGALLKHGFGGGLDGGQPADAGADVHAHAGFVQIRGVVQTGIGNRLKSGGNAVVDKHVHAPGFFGADVLADVEIFHFTGNLAGQIGSIKTGDGVNAAYAGGEVLPGAGNVVAHRRYLAQAGDDHSFFAHKLARNKKPLPIQAALAHPLRKRLKNTTFIISNPKTGQGVNPPCYRVFGICY